MKKSLYFILFYFMFFTFRMFAQTPDWDNMKWKIKEQNSNFENYISENYGKGIEESKGNTIRFLEFYKFLDPWKMEDGSNIKYSLICFEITENFKEMGLMGEMLYDDDGDVVAIRDGDPQWIVINENDGKMRRLISELIEITANPSNQVDFSDLIILPINFPLRQLFK